MVRFINFLKRRYPNNIYSIKIGLILVIPALLFRGFTAIYPMLYTGFLSFFEYTPLSGEGKVFVGFENFLRLARSPDIQDSLFFTLFFTVISTFLQICLGILIAIIINQKFFGRSAIRVVNILPWAIPAVITGLAARFAFHDQFGLINDILYRLFDIRPLWLNNLWGARITVTLVDVWKYVGFVALVFLAALQGIPKELREAAEVDGANRLQVIFKIILPLMKPIIIIMTIFTTIWRISSFDLIYTMTRGGPGTATSVVSYKIFEIMFIFLRWGYGSALSFVLLIIVLITVGIATIFLRRAEAEI